MALVDDLVSEVQSAGYDDFTPTTIVEMMQEILADVATESILDFYRSTATFTLTSGSVALGVPADVFAVLKMYDTSTGNVLTPVQKDDLVFRYSGQLTDTGDPLFYYKEGVAYKCYPIPTGDRPMVVDYSREPAALAVGGSTIDLPTRHKRLLVLGAIVQCAILEGDLDMAPGYDAAFQAKRERVLVDLNTSTHVDRPRIIHDVYWDDDCFIY